MISLLTLGFLLGMRHALEADHVAAVASLASHTSNMGDALRQGAAWGVGHTATLFLFGSIVILMDSVLPSSLVAGLEFAVGIMLIALGADVLRRLHRDRVHFHTHEHDNEQRHFHAHSHAGEMYHTESKHRHQHVEKFPKRALLVGSMHGMAGSAALIILTLQTVDSLLTGLIYMALFGTGSIVGMAALSTIIAVPLRYSANGATWLYNGLQILVASATLGIGGIIVLNYLNDFIAVS